MKRFIILSLCLFISLYTEAQLDLDFETDRGFYNTPFGLELTVNDPAATIRYTTDGTAPTTGSGNIYTGPIFINTSTSVRALAYTATETTKISAHTYVFVNDVINQPDSIAGFPTGTGMENTIQNDAQYGAQLSDALTSIPVVCISLDQNDYNFIYTNKGVSKPANVEFFDAVSGEDYGCQTGVNTYGNSSFVAATADKKNYRFKFRAEFGPTKFEFPLFGEDAAGEFDTWDLRGGGQETIDRGGVQNIHEKILKDWQIQTSGLGVHGRFVHVYINAVYWGVYTASERPEKAFGASYLEGDKDDYNTMKATCCDATALPIDGTADSYNYMKTQTVNYPAIEQYLDVDHFIDWVILCNYGPHGDWTTWNTYAIDNPVAGEPYRFFIWDPEPSFSNDWYYTDKIVDTYQHEDIWQPLKANADFRMRVADHFECNCIEADGPINPVNAETYYTNVFDAHSLAYLAECARWADKTLYNEFLQYRDDLVSSGWFYNRMDTMKTAYENNDLYPSIEAVGFSQYGGEVAAGVSITLTNPNGAGTIYYTTDGTDPRAAGGGIAATAQTYTAGISLPQGVVEVKARVYAGGIWSALCPRRFYVEQNYTIAINEIMYRPDSLCTLAAIDSSELDYIELINIGTEAVDLADCSFTDGITFEFPYPSILQAGDLIVLAEDADEFQTVYGFAPFGQYKGGLSNDGERLELSDPFGNIIDSLTYNDKNPWDEDPDGEGPSLELLNPFSDNNDPLNWFRSDNDCGTPGLVNSRVCTGTAEQIIINEINYNSDNDGFDPGDWVELHNPTANTIDISGWTFYDNNNDFIFPAGTSIAAGEFLVLVENGAIFNSLFPHLDASQYLGDFTFGLSNKGERVSLFDENKCLSDYVIYNDKLPWDTIPDGNGPTLSLITPNSDNALALSWEASSNINSNHGTPGRENAPCPESEIIFPNIICAGIPATITVDNLYDRMIYNWSIFGASPSNAATENTTVVWNTPGTYNIQLITSYFECTKVYNQQVTVLSCNDAPIAVDDSFTTLQETQLNDDLSPNDSDPNGNNLSWISNPVTAPANGSLLINADGTFTYTPNLGFVGNDSFVYQVCDDAVITSIGSNVFIGQVSSSADDVEELATDGSINVTSGDLDIMEDGAEIFSAVGIRITNINIPQNATITDARLEFVADENNSQATSLTISAEDIGNAAPLSTTPFAISTKTKTSAANWSNIPAWTAGNTYSTIDISTVIQEVISRADWQSSNAMTFIIEGTGIRTPESYDGGASVAPRLIVNYELPDNGFNVSLCDEATVTVTVEQGCIDLDIYAFLEGPYAASLGEMGTELNTLRGLLPGQTPLSNLINSTPAGQPYSGSPWNYTGTEGAAWTDANYTDGVVDWVLVSTRTDIPKSSEVGRAAGLLHKDGSISFPESCALENLGLDSVYIVVEHRNHMGVMSYNKVSITNNTLTYDFRLSDSYKDATSFGQKQASTGDWLMFAGDADQSDFPSFDIKGTDKALWLDNNGLFQQYMIPDFDLNGDVNGGDKALWFGNNGVASRVPK